MKGIPVPGQEWLNDRATYAPAKPLHPDRLLSSTEAIRVLGGHSVTQLDWWRQYRDLRGTDVGGVVKYSYADLVKAKAAHPTALHRKDRRDIRLLVGITVSIWVGVAVYMIVRAYQ